MCLTNAFSNADVLQRPQNQLEIDDSLWADNCNYMELDTCLNLNPNNYNLLILQLNIRSLLAHQHELKQLLQDLGKKNSSMDVVLLCETFLTKKTIGMVNVAGYTHVGNYRNTKKGGGVSILIKDGISYRRRQDLDVFQEGETESVFIEILSKSGKTIIIGSMYRPPNTDITQFSTNICTITSLARKTKGKCCPEIIIGMDHNIDLLKGSCHNTTQQFITDLSNIDLLPTITRPTRITSHSATLIDNIYVSNQLHRDFESSIIMDDLSDHFPVLTMLKQTKLLNKEPLTFTSRCLNDQKLKEANHKLMRKDWVGLLTGTTCDEKFNQFSMILNTTLDEVAPTRTVRISGKRRYVEPWMTKGLEEASRTKLKLYKKYLLGDGSDEDLMKYKRYRNIYNETKRKLKFEYYQAKCESYKSNSKKLWSLINSTITKVKHKGSIIPYITVDGIKKTRPVDIANSFGDFYARLGPNLANNIASSTTSIDEYISRIPRQLNSIVLRATTVQEIDKIIQDLPNKSSHGHDEISNVTLKALRPSIIFPLCHIFNQSLVEGMFPEKMKWVEIIPLYKGKRMDLTINYRPISLLIIISKVLEKLIYKRVYSFLETNNILFSSQYGFRTKRSCEQAIMEVVGYALQAKNNKEKCACLYLDLSKAFDTLDHNILLKKLNNYGIRGKANLWFQNYLSNRSLIAKVTTSPNKVVKSERFDITYGTAQGSCLGPLLFILFVNDIHHLPIYSKLILFADDTTLFNSHYCSKYLRFMLEHDLNIMIDWFNANKLSLNLQKTVSMQFWNNTANLNLYVGETIIPTVESTKFLGVQIDNQLSWRNHANHVIDKLHTNRRLMALGKNLLDRDSLRKIYFAHIHSHLNYGLTIWGSMLSSSSLKALSKLQTHCIELIASRRQIDALTTMRQLNILPLKSMIRFNLCKLGQQMTHKLLPKPLQDIINADGGKKTHRYPTRNRFTPNIQKHQCPIFNRSFLCQGIKEFVKLKDNLKQEHNPYRFAKQLKNYLSSD